MTVLWVASSVTVANGSALVTVNTSEDVTKIETSATFHGVGFSLPYEIKRVYNDGSSDIIELYEPWAGSNGTIEAVAAPSGASVTRAADSLASLQAVYEALADSVSTTATANSIAQRDSNGRIKGAAATASDDLVTFGQLGAGALAPDFRPFGIGVFNNPESNLDNLEGHEGGLFTGYESLNGNASLGDNPWPTGGGAFGVVNIQGVNNDPLQYNAQLAMRMNNASPSIKFRARAGGKFSGWFDVYGKYNTNFNELLADGSTGTVLVEQAYSTTEIRFYIPIFFNRIVTSITINGTFSLSYFQNQVATGLGSADIELLSSSRNIAVIRITSLTALDLNRNHILYAEQSSASIKLNFAN